MIRWRWIPPLAVLIVALVALSVGACATRGEYWRKVREPQPVREVRYVLAPCGHADWSGCARIAAGVIEIKRGMTQTRTDCTLTHEQRHFAGDDHPEFDTADAFDKFASDCGDGSMFVKRLRAWLYFWIGEAIEWLRWQHSRLK